MIVGTCAAIVLSRGTFVDAPGRSAALAGSLAGRGIVAAPSDVVWVEGPRGALGSFGPSSRALVRGAAAEGEALSFAAGCLVAAWREMLTSAQGRFVLTSYAVALGIMVPTGVLPSQM